MPALIHANHRPYDHFVGRFLERYPDVAAAIDAAGGFVVVFSPARSFEEDEELSPEVITERVRLGLAEAEREVAGREGVPVFVCETVGIPLFLVLEGENPLLTGLTPGRGVLAGYVMCGEGGAVYYAPDGRHGSWEGARAMVLEQIALLPRRLGGLG